MGLQHFPASALQREPWAALAMLVLHAKDHPYLGQDLCRRDVRCNVGLAGLSAPGGLALLYTSQDMSWSSLLLLAFINSCCMAFSHAIFSSAENSRPPGLWDFGIEAIFQSSDLSEALISTLEVSGHCMRLAM